MKRTILLILIISLGTVMGWSNGGKSSNCKEVKYGTHDFIAERALEWLESYEPDVRYWMWLEANKDLYLLGTEAPDFSSVPICLKLTIEEIAEFGDTLYHHIFWQKDAVAVCSGEDDAARRAQETYEKVITALSNCNYKRAAFYAGVMTHYIADPSSFCHLVGEDACYRTYTSLEERLCHGPYEAWVDEMIMTGNYPYVSFDYTFDYYGDEEPAYQATLTMSRVVDQGNYYNPNPEKRGFIRDVAWMMSHCSAIGNTDSIYYTDFYLSMQDTLNLAINTVTDVLHYFGDYIKSGDFCPKVDLFLNGTTSEYYNAQVNSPFYLDVKFTNPVDEINVDFYLLIKIGDTYYFYPSFSESKDFQTLTLFKGEYKTNILSINSLPETVRNIGQIEIYSAILQYETENGLYSFDYMKINFY